MAECAAVCEHLHLPLQAGSDRTLARMHRGYTAERYLARLAAARAAVPDLERLDDGRYELHLVPLVLRPPCPISEHAASHAARRRREV